MSKLIKGLLWLSLSILAFFRCSAHYKRRLLLPSALLLFAGVFILSLEIL